MFVSSQLAAPLPAPQAFTQSHVSVPPHPLAALDAAAATICFDKDRAIFTEGEPARFCYRVLGGAVRLVKQMEDGRRQVVEFLLPGDLFGLDALGRHDLTAETVIASTVQRHRREAVERLADRDPALARALRMHTIAGLIAARERLVLLGRRSASERLARFLLEMETRAPRGGAGRVALPMGRADIADHLGLTPETVCRLLTSLRHEGIIGTGRAIDGAEVMILDPAALHALAEAPRH